MERAVDRIKEIISSLLERENVQLKEEIEDLREQVSQLTEALQVKDKQCRHIAAVLHEKNSEWKRIKEKLTGNKRGISESLKNGSIPESVKDEITDIIKNENTKIKKSMEGVEDIKENNTNVNANITVTGTSLDDSTQLPSQRSPSQSPSNHLDTLIDLITDASDTEEEHEQEQQPVHDSNHRTFQEISSRQLQPQMVEGRKRKSHARGCACCEKYYAATRSPSSTSTNPPDSFLVSPNTPPGFWDTSFTPHQ